MTTRSFNQMWFGDYVSRRGLSIGGWEDSEVVVTTVNVIHRQGDITWHTLGKELVRVPLFLIETDIDEAFEYVNDAIRLEGCFGS